MAKKRPTAAETAPGREPRASYWRRQIEACAASGLSQAEFCRRHSLSVASLQWWKWKLGSSPSSTRPSRATVLASATPSSPPGPAFLPVRLVSGDEQAGPLGGSRPAIYEVELRSGHRIRVAGDFEPVVLARLIRTVEAASC